jgi:thiol-disulfide isomerase/thioredoxin
MPVEPASPGRTPDGPQALPAEGARVADDAGRTAHLRRRRLVAATAAVAGAAGLGWALRQPASSSASPAQQTMSSGGEAPPPLAALPAEFWAQVLEQPGGGRLALASLAGAPLVINYWATWCPPCIREMPELDRFYEQYKASGWKVLGIAIDQAQAVQRFLQTTAVRYPIALGGAEGLQWVHRLAGAATGLPFTAICNRQASIIWRKAGEIRLHDLQEQAARA